MPLETSVSAISMIWSAWQWSSPQGPTEHQVCQPIGGFFAMPLLYAAVLPTSASAATVRSIVGVGEASGAVLPPFQGVQNAAGNRLFSAERRELRGALFLR